MFKTNYEDFVRDKFVSHKPTGITSGFTMPKAMFDHQVALTTWALRRGRAAIFADTGLGKMLIELAWADAVCKHTGMPVMIHTPLAVAAQIAAEGRKFGIEATVVREANEVTPGINIMNYERLHKLDTSIFGGVVLDESGCIKHHDAKTFRALTDAYMYTPFKLPATATPAPNDWSELGTHAEFIGICTRAEMLAEFFTHDGGETSVWRLKGHARSLFWQWVASWGAMIRKPSDLGFDDGAYNLPPLRLHEHTVDTAAPLNGMLFAMEAQTLSERRGARRESINERVAKAFEVIRSSWISNKRANTTDSIESPTLSDSRRIESDGMSKMQMPNARVQESTPQSQSAPPQSKHQERSTTKLTPSRDASTCESGTRGSATNLSPKTESDALAPSKAELNATGGCAEISESACLSTTQCLSGREAGAPFAQRSGQATGQDLPSTIAMQQETSEGSFVSPAMLASGGSKMTPIACAAPQTTCRVQWVVWVELNAEQDALEKLFGDDCVSVYGSLTTDEKIARYERFKSGEVPVLITKPSIFGYGVNMQFSCHAAFVGVTDSFEAYYQTVRRQWRFGQTRPVHVHLFSSLQEGAVASNLRRKEKDALEMAKSLSAETHDAVFAEVIGKAHRETNAHEARKKVAVPLFLISEPAKEILDVCD